MASTLFNSRRPMPCPANDAAVKKPTGTYSTPLAIQSARPSRPMSSMGMLAKLARACSRVMA
nr:hypothetical protein [Hydrogenophaga sp. PBL-H3]